MIKFSFLTEVISSYFPNYLPSFRIRMLVIINYSFVLSLHGIVTLAIFPKLT